jgi:hypothetical protein
MACALVQISIHADLPIGSREVVDGVTGQRLRIRR